METPVDDNLLVTPATEFKTGTRSRGWVFTINNYTEDEIETVKSLTRGSVYVIAGFEVGKKTGTPHIQGYVYYTNARSYSAMKDRIGRSWIKAAKGTGVQNQAYCSKQGDVFVEHGVPPKQGERTDIEAVYDQLRDGASMRTILEGDNNLQCLQIAEKYLKYKEEERDFVTEIKVYWGPPGAGKTRAAREWLGEDTYTCNRTTSKFWDGYDAHQGVLIDDFRSDWCKFVELLGITDRYAYRVEVKGGARQLRARKIAITSPFHPRDWFSGISEDIDQLMGRISEIHHIDGSSSRRSMPKEFRNGIEIPPAETFSNPGSEHHGEIYRSGLPQQASNNLFSSSSDGEVHISRSCNRSCTGSLSGGEGSLPILESRGQGSSPICHQGHGRHNRRHQWGSQRGIQDSIDPQVFSWFNQAGIINTQSRREHVSGISCEQEYPDWPQDDGLQEDDDADSC